VCKQVVSKLKEVGHGFARHLCSSEIADEERIEADCDDVNHGHIARGRFILDK
jgi:hypothetical protein